jgi:hypothetical protein
MPANGKNECRAVQVARTFFKACTKLSDDDEDILPQVSSLIHVRPGEREGRQRPLSAQTTYP